MDSLATSLKNKLHLEMENVSSPELQLQKFISHVQHDETIVQRNSREICQLLEQTFRPIFPTVRAVPFGSSQTGLHLKDSDYDIFFDIEGRIPGAAAPPSGTVLTYEQVFNMIITKLNDNSSKFSSIIPLINARVPVLKFCYNPLDIKCDIVLTADFALVNTRLMKHYIKMDNKIKPMMLILKRWTKSLGLYGMNKIQNTSLFMMLIFYLEQPHVDLIPTVKRLQESCRTIQRVSGWNVNFDENIVKHQSKYSSSIPELIQGFFSFYAKFDFLNGTICPFDGVIKTKKSLINTGTKYDLQKPAWIQDPFQHTLNIADNIPEKFINDFQEYCKKSAAALTGVKNDKLKNLLLFVLDPLSNF